MNPVNWFEIPVSSLDRAIPFYQSVFGYELQRSQMGNSEMGWFPGGPDGAGATGTLIQDEGYQPSHAGSLVYFSVESIENTLDKVNEAGGKTLLPKMSIGEFGFIAHFQDTEGNRVALHAIS